MAKVKLKCVMGRPGLKSSYQEKGLLIMWKYIRLNASTFRSSKLNKKLLEEKHFIYIYFI